MQYNIRPNHCKGWPSQRRALVPPVSKLTLFFHQLSPERFVDRRDRSLSACLSAWLLVYGWVCGCVICMYILSYHSREGGQGGLWGAHHPGACALTTTKRAASETGGRGASVEAMDVHDDDDDDDDGDGKYPETLHNFSVLLSLSTRVTIPPHFW